MKLYHLIIAYNDETEELEYIEEFIEDLDKTRTSEVVLESEIELDDDYFDDEELVSLISKEGLAEA